MDTHIFIFVAYANLIGILLSLCIRYIFINKKKNNFLHEIMYIAAHGLYTFLQETTQKRAVSFGLFSSFFFLSFILLLYNLLVLIPFMEEVTQDLNVTFALAIFAFIIVHLHSFKLNKKIYMHHWIKNPISYTQNYTIKDRIIHIGVSIVNGLISLCLLPLELLSRLSLVLSLSFRLYGNIFGGAMIAYLLKSFMMQSWIYQSLGTFSGLQLLVMLFFGLIEGCIQTFIFVIISINNIGLLTSEN